MVQDSVVVVAGSSQYEDHGEGLPVYSQDNAYMWVLDIETEKWRRVELPRSVVPILQESALFSQKEDFLFYSPTCCGRLSLSGVATYDTSTCTTLREDTGWHTKSVVDIGPYICVFRSQRGADDEYLVGVYIIDPISGDATPCDPLPIPGLVKSACMLNPTTVLVLLLDMNTIRDKLVMLDIDIHVFDRYTDADMV
ncbi:hypothetical protein KIPB_014300 [Kipferlia bialata]|uniref:Uncharacterized protein n=1 Tax=Kipferlia bialata TaxID=797122 RepID=A0A391NT33_9EUKA|nr:hypothetical protein KIPB_014300 [Kipferlia bialata]|eukprot:g14300.t1